MKFPTYKEFGEIVAKEALDTFEYNGKTLREWIEIISAAELGTNLAEVGTNLISRQAAIDALMERFKRVPTNAIIAKDVIENLPSAQPERKTGHWILDRSGAYCCDNCMEPCADYIMMKPRDKFCKMCGSRNEVME